MTMEEVADEKNLMQAFDQVAANKGAPGPDRQSILEVQGHLHEILPTLRSELLEGSYRPGMIRRVWIPKPGGGQRGLGIPNVIDRLVSQAVHQVLSPHFEPTFHRSSHGFRPGLSCHTAIAEAKGYLEEGRKWLVDDKSAVARPEERHFLGFCLRNRPTDGAVDVLLSERTEKRLAAKVRELTPRNWGQSFDDCLIRLNQYLLGWTGFFSICSKAAVAVTLRRMDAHIRRRLRVILLRQKKRKRYIVRWLIQCGVKPATAWGSIYNGHRSLWALSHNPAVERAVPNAYLARLGLVSLERRWRELQPDVNAPGQLRLALG
jgi:hypothetical protein